MTGTRGTGGKPLTNDSGFLTELSLRWIFCDAGMKMVSETQESIEEVLEPAGCRVRELSLWQSR